MDAFFRRNARLLSSIIFVVIGLIAAGYSLFYLPKQRRVEHAAAFTAVMAPENGRLSKLAEARKTREANLGVRSSPEFLKRVNAVANQANVYIDRLAPHENAALTFDLKIEADYLTFLKFTQQLESLDVIIDDLQIHPFKQAAIPPLHVITFSLTPRNDARELSGQRLAALKQAVDEPGTRNPFQRFAFKKGVEVRKEIELTWIYKLSGIGSVGGNRTATIDGHDYKEGDSFADMKIASIDSDTVNLKSESGNGDERFVIGFRKK